MLKYLTLYLIIVITQTSCLKDPCTQVFCSQKGECINGTCSCVKNYTGSQCENSYATYFAGQYEVFDTQQGSVIDTITVSVYNAATDSISIANYAGISDNHRVLAIVQNDSTANIFEQSVVFFNEDSVEQQLIILGTLIGKPTDTLMLSSTYIKNYTSFRNNKKLIRISN